MTINWHGGDEKSLSLLRAISLLLNRNQTLLKFIFDSEKPRLRKRAGILRDDSWKFTEAEQLKIRVALDIWSGSGHVHLWEILESWNESDWKLFSTAVCEAQSKNSPDLDSADDDRNPT